MRNNSRYPLLAREGWVHTAVATGAAAAVHYYAGPLWAAPLWLAGVFVRVVFRRPAAALRAGPAGPPRGGGRPLSSSSFPATRRARSRRPRAGWWPPRTGA